MKEKYIKIIVILFLFSGGTLGANDIEKFIATSHYRGCDYNYSGWHCKPAHLPQFIPLGFSADGWLAWVSDPNGDVVTNKCTYCPDPPCAGVSLTNIYCYPECVSDTPSHKGDRCYCPLGSTDRELRKFNISPMKGLESGCFPLKLGDDEFNVEFVYKKKLIYPEMIMPGEKSGPKFPGTQVFFTSRNKGRKLMYIVNHNHGGFAPHTIQALGWLKTPFPGRIVVLLAVGTDVNEDGNPTVVGQIPVGVDLSEGFKK
jgi:hypothetical protein